MFEWQIFDSLRKANEMNVRMQQELFKRWTALWPGVPGAPFWGEQVQALQKKWAEAVNELVRRQCETQQEQFAVGLKQIEQAFALAEIKDIEVLRTKTLELWQKTFQLFQQSSEAQVRDFQAAVARWTELVTKAA
jgi:hypothetical protein